MSLDSLAIALEGIGYDSAAIATLGYWTFEVVEEDDNRISDADIILRRRRSRGRTKDPRERERELVVIATLSGNGTSDLFKKGYEKQTVDERSRLINVAAHLLNVDASEIVLEVNSLRVLKQNIDVICDPPIVFK